MRLWGSGLSGAHTTSRNAVPKGVMPLCHLAHHRPGAIEAPIVLPSFKLPCNHSLGPQNIH